MPLSLRQLEPAPSSQLALEEISEEGTNSSIALKLKEFVIQVAGTYRTRFNLGVGASTNGYGQIYVNGVPKGSVRVQRTAGGFTVYVEDIGGLKQYDLLQLYAWHTDSTNLVTVSNFSISASYQELPSPIPAKVN